MMEIDKYLLENLKEGGSDSKTRCRSCLISNEEIQSVFNMEAELADQIFECSQVRIVHEDGLPNGLCNECRSDLYKAYMFRMRIRQSDQILKHVKWNSEEDKFIKNNLNLELVKVECETNMEINASDLKKGANKEKFKCEKCHKPLGSKPALDRHRASFHERVRPAGDLVGCSVTGRGKDRKFNCTECPYSTPSKPNFRCHMRTHTGEKPYGCADCGRVFSQRATLRGHCAAAHSDLKQYACQECGKRFKRKSVRDRHRRKHDDKLICDICQKTLKSKDTMIAHLNRHYNIKNYACETCGKLFTTRDEFNNHSGVHAVDRKFPCHLCPYVTHVKTYLNKHLVRHTSEKRYRCEACDALFRTKAELRNHSRKHSKQKNHSCPVCDAKFAFSYSITVHMRRVHGLQYSNPNPVDPRTVKPLIMQ